MVELKYELYIIVKQRIGTLNSCRMHCSVTMSTRITESGLKSLFHLAFCFVMSSANLTSFCLALWCGHLYPCLLFLHLHLQ